jgi:predicted branched-subunit amino acid permease
MSGAIARLLDDEGGWRRHFAGGFVAMLPLWFAALPSGLAYAIAAQGAGLGPATAQLFSLLAFSAAGQIGTLVSIGTGAPPAVAIGTAILLNGQLLLLGLTIGRQLRPTWASRLLLAPLLTDGAFAVVAARGPLRLSALSGAGLSMYIAWNAGTAAGLVAGRAIPDLHRFGGDFALPMVFLALLVPLVRSRATLYVALTAGLTTLLLGRIATTGIAILGAGLLASAVGAALRPGAAQAAGGEA